MVFHIITLFPESFESYINSSIIGRAIRDGKIKIKFYNPRDFAVPTKTQKNKKKPYLRVDNAPYGGGVGMVMEALPIIKAVEKALKQPHPRPLSLQRREGENDTLIVWLAPSEKQFTNEMAEKISKKYENVIIICGRYEGIDARVLKILKDLKLKIEKLTVGPYILTGGELPAMVILDSVARRIPGVLGKIESVEENRISSSEVYTRPEVLEYPFSKLRTSKSKKYKVPKILLSGNHAKIEEWKKKRK